MSTSLATPASALLGEDAASAARRAAIEAKVAAAKLAQQGTTGGTRALEGEVRVVTQRTDTVGGSHVTSFVTAAHDEAARAPPAPPAPPPPPSVYSQGFEAAATFAGARAGKVFRAGAEGVGYYRDTPPPPATPSAAQTSSTTTTTTAATAAATAAAAANATTATVSGNKVEEAGSSSSSKGEKPAKQKLKPQAMSAQQLHAYGVALFTGKIPGQAKNEAGAVSLWSLAVSKFQHVESQVALGMAKWNGDGCDKDIPAALELLRRAGRAGGAGAGAQAAYFLGVAYLDGDAVARDTGRAHRWLRQAAKHQHAEAMYALGSSLMTSGGGGSGDAEALSRGCDWVSAAAALGHERAADFIASVPAHVRPDVVAALDGKRAAGAAGAAGGGQGAFQGGGTPGHGIGHGYGNGNGGGGYASGGGGLKAAYGPYAGCRNDADADAITELLAADEEASARRAGGGGSGSGGRGDGSEDDWLSGLAVPSKAKAVGGGNSKNSKKKGKAGGKR